MFSKNQYRGRDWKVSRFKGGLGKKEGVVLLRGRRGGGLTPKCTICLKMHLNIINLFLLKEIQHTSKLLELI